MSPNAPVSRCSTCQRPIIWAVSPSGARLPLDARPATMYYLDGAEPTPNALPVTAEVIIEPRGQQGMWGPESEDEAPKTAVKTYISHFLSCPQAAEHSRRKS